ncbi:MAG: ATP-binding protein [Bacteroidales bacterium]|nr:ATP-binding protein [Bacteroidales bacterium]HOK98620.1 ATP-binding protein [Bacteroidales bacterium]HPO65472.1 ATP-binding protein [Bacteroidales bacterium]
MENIALHILDIVQNAIEAGATRISIEIEKNDTNRHLRVMITDNGRGMSEEMITRALDPFYTSRTTRKVGIGLPLLKQQVEQTGGFLHIISQPHKGTTVSFGFNLEHIDCPPLGNIADVCSTLFIVNPQIDFYLHVSNGKCTFTCESKKILEIFDRLPLSQGELRQYIYSFLKENMDWLVQSKCTT